MKSSFMPLASKKKDPLLTGSPEALFYNTKYSPFPDMWRKANFTGNTGYSRLRNIDVLLRPSDSSNVTLYVHFYGCLSSPGDI